MLQPQSSTIVMYLARADEAREHARRATLKSERIFYERMEERWMGLAASTAFAERVSLFLLTVPSPSLPRDTCPQCHGIMTTEVLETDGGREVYTLRCRHCGDTECRTVMRYTLGDASPGGAASATDAPRAADQSV